MSVHEKLLADGWAWDGMDGYTAPLLLPDPALPGVARRAIFAESRRLWPDCKWTTKALPVDRKYQVWLAYHGILVSCVHSTKLSAMQECFAEMERIVE